MKTTQVAVTRRSWTTLGALSFALFISAGCNYQGSFVISGGNSNLPGSASRAQKGELAADLKKVELENKFGEVKVVASEDGSFGWSWKLEARAQTDALAEEAAGEVKLNVVTNGNSLSLTLVLPEAKRNRQFKSNLEIHAPKTIAVRTRNSFGPMTIAGVDGPVEARGEFGQLDIRGIRTEVQAQNSFASMIVQNTGAATLKNQNGPLEATSIHGALDADTSFAPLIAKDITGTLKVNNQNGAVTVEKVTGKSEIKTSFAHITATDLGGSLKAHNQNGAVTVNHVTGNADITTSFAPLTLAGVSGDAVLSNQNGGIKVQEVGGDIKANTSFATMDIQGNGHNFDCRNQNGSINLRAASPDVSKIEAHTSFANLEVHLASSLKPAISAHTSFGNIESDFPVIMKGHGQDTFAGVDSTTPHILLENQNGGIHVLGEKITASVRPQAERQD